ncbi:MULTISPECIES: quinolinate synthase NadA [unclassified Nitrosomonas]|jgi:quinolinate synthase|uniref:quinolinate synthase NadA n=1 Tax=unclassified Nitrosomonas TaxID=2609265 RepID=UPI00088CEAFE|nr:MULTISPECIES: quinolinate synthase NadA [unclassified Nitrosomonas]SDG82464.1 quinolinate synthase [Nitrosomonas sp. Nm132]SDY02150.1 quinolinate synthase [Nitrosomonas sp. Nm58]
MHANAIDFENYELLQDETCAQRIIAAKEKLGKRAVILAHHYQRADVYRHADLTGDSLKLSYLAAQTDADYLVFCGVHFMAEVADILSSPEQIAILPDLAAGCSMADMANLSKVERVWRELAEILDPEEAITPVTYINSSADLKAFCGEHGGIVCTSSNATKILQWSFAQREKVLFFPDQHLGRWSGYKLGLSLEQMPVWDFDEPMGGLTEEQIRKAKILLWKGHCSVHQMFQPQHILRFRNQYPEGLVISHPECSFEVCKASDYVGSTEYIINTIREAEAGTRWLVGTELNLVGRIAEEFKSQGKIVQFMSPMVCMCSTMARIDPQHLAWSLENLATGNVVNPIRVPPHEAKLAKLALEKMLAVSR